MANKTKKSNFIPSPYPAVTGYEKAFVNAFNKNLAAAMHDVLKYIANTAARTIKDGISINNYITQPLNLPTKKK